MKKIILIIFMAMISSFSYYGAVNEKGEKVVDFGTSLQEENIIENETIEKTQENEIEQEESTMAQAEVIQNQETDKQDEVKETVTTPVVENKSTGNKKDETVQQTQTESKQVNTSIVETQPKKEEQPPQQATKTITESDLEYWCVAGGSHHIAGDGANEHGYYKSWDEAYQAFLNYTSGWSSVQFKVSQCSCGLYYFWAIQ